MGMLHRMEKWSATHHPRWFVLLRVALGICLIVKGISFMSNTIALESLLAETNVGLDGDWPPLAITWLHLICGLMIIIGLFTRWAALLMIPILFGAVIYVNAARGLFAAESEFGFSLVVLLMLIVFFVEGGGPLSLDDYFKRNPY
ncbi:MAG TPA: DoxX family protein [Chitinophagaceae bacterium]|nr:DoxX family protein [Chitinophagaceae bacterium]